MIGRRGFSNIVTSEEINCAEAFTETTDDDTSADDSPACVAAETLETANITPTSAAIKLGIRTDRFGVIRAMYDSGASLNIVDAAWALKNFGCHVKNTKDFYCATANGNIVIRQFIRVRCSNYFGGTPFFAKFYLLRNSPHRFIMSRGMFWRLGYKIMRPDGKFVVQSQNEETAPDLYDNIFKSIDYPLAGETLLVDPAQCSDPTEFLCHLAAVHERWEQKDPLHQYPPRYDDVAMVDNDWLVVQGNHVLCALDASTAQRWRTRQDAETARRALPPIDIPRVGDRVGLTREQILAEAKTTHGKINSPKVKREFYELLVEDGKRYAAHMADVGVIPGVEFEIKLKPGTRPFHTRPYPHSHEKAMDSRRQIAELLAGGFITVSESSWAAPYLMVPKPTRKGKKEWRMAIDYRGLNERTIKDRYPIPTMRELYAKLRGGRVFSCLDLRSGYHHIAVRKEDRPKTAFITEYGLYEWTRMTFGFCNAPSVFQRAMNQVFGDLDNVIVYIDDIVLVTETEEEHLALLREVFRRLKANQMTLRLIKCKFFQAEVKYLGLIVNQEGIRCDEAYVRKVLTFKEPTNTKELERYLGMVAWLGRFIPNLSKLTSALTSIKKKEFVWTEEHQRHFEAIQRAVHAVKILRHPDLGRPFFVQTDASERALGAVLLQDFGGKHLEPIEFISRKLTDCETRWHCSEQELVAVVYACNRWIKLLLPKPFTVFTDHKNLEILFTKGPGMKSRKLQRWIVQLQQFDFVAKYLPGKDNYIADFLSRDVTYVAAAEALRCEFLLILPAEGRTGVVEDEQPDSIEELLCLATTEARVRERCTNWNQLYVVRAHEATCHAVRRSQRLSSKARVNYDEDALADAQLAGSSPVLPKLVLPDLAENNQAARPDCGASWSQTLNEKRFRKVSLADPFLQRVVCALKDGTAIDTLPKDLRDDISAKKVVLSEDGLVYRKGSEGRAVPFVPLLLQSDVVRYFHTARVFCHQGQRRTYATLRRHYYWRNMHRDAYRFCVECDVCRVTRLNQARHAKGQLTSILATRPFEMVSMDIVGPLPICSSGSRYLLTIMDRFTRYVAAIPMTEITAAAVSTRFVNDWVFRYGTPDSLLADNGTQFTSVVLRVTCELLKIDQRFSTIYHPECNGQIERWHRFMKQRLAIRQKQHGLDFMSDDDWDVLIPSIVFSYNATVHTITGRCPFELLYGRLPELPLRLAKLASVKLPQTRGYEDYLRSLTQMLGILRNKVLQVTFVKARALDEKVNATRIAFDFAIGSLVYRKALGLKGNLATFTDKWLGPYEVLSKTDRGAFKLQHVEDAQDAPLINGKYLVRAPPTVTRQRGGSKSSKSRPAAGRNADM